MFPRYFLFLLMPLGLFAQESLPLYVSFDFDVEEVAAHYGNDQTEKEKEIAAMLSALCVQQIGFWTFQEGDDYPNLAISLVKDTQLWQMKVVLKHDETSVSGEWECDLFELNEIDLEGMPGKDQWPQKVETVFNEGILKDNMSPLLECIRQIPVGKTVGLVEHESEVVYNMFVLPLDFEKYQDLTNSLFRIDFKKDRTPLPPLTIYVHSRASCYPFEFPGIPMLSGVLVEHEKWQKKKTDPLQDIPEDFLTILSGYKPGSFYLLDPNRDSWREGCEMMEIAGGSQ